jgi:hypothetical protein
MTGFELCRYAMPDAAWMHICSFMEWFISSRSSNSRSAKEPRTQYSVMMQRFCGSVTAPT